MFDTKPMQTRSYRPGFMDAPFLGTAVGRLIIANVAVFGLQQALPAFSRWFALTPRLAVEHFQVWQIVTYMFLHGDFWHLFFNMVVLFFMGNMVESAWGPRRFLRYYLACGIGGALLHMALQYNASVLGASGAIFGLYLAAAMLFPDATVYLYFVLPIKIKYFAMGLAAMQLFFGLGGPSGVAYFAHLGGMLAGLFFFRTEIARRLRFATGPRRRWNGYVEEKKRTEEKASSDNIDSILDRISEKGYENLSSTEKRILEKYSRDNRNHQP